MGFFDLLNPMFSAIETYVLGWLPAWAIVSLWGLLSGILTMIIYTKVSNQEALSVGKQESKDALKQMRELDPDADLDVVLPTMRRAILAPLNQAKNSLGPALWASIPLVFCYDSFEYKRGLCVQTTFILETLVKNESHQSTQGFEFHWFFTDFNGGFEYKRGVCIYTRSFH